MGGMPVLPNTIISYLRLLYRQYQQDFKEWKSAFDLWKMRNSQCYGPLWPRSLQKTGSELECRFRTFLTTCDYVKHALCVRACDWIYVLCAKTTAAVLFKVKRRLLALVTSRLLCGCVYKVERVAILWGLLVWSDVHRKM